MKKQLNSPALFPGFLFLCIFVFYLYLGRLHGLAEIFLPLDSLVRSAQFNDFFPPVHALGESLVASAWFPPLPLILRAPFALLPFPVEPTAPGRVLAAFFCAATVPLVDLYSRQRGHSFFLRLFLALLLSFNPLFLGAVAAGSDTAATVFLLAGSMVFSCLWMRERNLSDFLFFSVFLSFLALSRAGAFFYAPIFIIPPVLLLRSASGKRAFSEGLILIAAAPVIYLLLVWALFNWLLLGDWFYFMRGFAGHLGHFSWAAFFEPTFWVVPLAAFPALAVLLPVGLVFLCLERRYAEFFFFLLLFPLVCLVAAIGVPGNLPAFRAADFIVLVPAGMIFVAASLPPRAADKKKGLSLLPSAGAQAGFLLVILAATLAFSPGWRNGFREENHAQRLEQAHAIHRAVSHFPPGSTIISTGYQGYFLQRFPLPGETREKISQRFLFDEKKIYPAPEPTYLVLAEPGIFALSDHIYLQRPSIYREGAPFLLLKERLPGWKIYRFIFRPRDHLD